MLAILTGYYPAKVLYWVKEGKLFARGWVYRSKDPKTYWSLFYMIVGFGILFVLAWIIGAFYLVQDKI
jgi:hypothetical protein